jgi:hypothetical protein
MQLGCGSCHTPRYCGEMSERCHQRRKRSSNWPISYALDMFGDKWTLLVVRDMMFKGKQRYGEFLRSPERIATNILADRLETLRENGWYTSRRIRSGWEVCSTVSSRRVSRCSPRWWR